MTSPTLSAQRRTLVAIIGSIVTITSAALLEVWSEEQAGLDAFAEEQAVVARSLAVLVEERLRTVRKDAQLIAESADEGRRATWTVLSPYADLRLRREGEPKLVVPPPSTSFVLTVALPDRRVVDLALPHAAITSMFSKFERPGQQVLLLLPPRENAFRAPDGRSIAFPSLSRALHGGTTSMRLLRDEARLLGLVPRLAVAGLASVDAGELGMWGIAAVVSAERLRDRERRARTRVVLSVLLSGGLVAAFGSIALRRQRRELELGREMAVAAVERDHEARLDQAARAATLGTLAMGIAHEISTPASVIQGRAEQLATRLRAGLPDDERAHTAVQAIGDQAMRISQVVRGFLSLARGDTGATEGQSVDVAQLVDGAKALVEHRFTKARVNLIADVQRDVPALRGDRRLLEHAVTNLLLNACDACDAGGTVELNVRGATRRGGAEAEATNATSATDATDAHAHAVEIEVLDDGAGISPEHAAHVTQPFFTTKDADKGTGLGLAITSEIVRAHRGSLVLEPRAPRGTRAVLSLPASSSSHATRTDRGTS